MTGYGRAGFEVGDLSFDVEVRSVNHRYLDARLKLPRGLADREHALKALAKEKLRRGKVVIQVSPASSGVAAQLDVDLGAGRRGLVGLEVEGHQQARDAAAAAHPGHHLLPRIASLGMRSAASRERADALGS